MPREAIFLNGASSSGKSTLAKKIQTQLKEPFVLLSVDTFINSMKFPDWSTKDIWEKFPPLFHVACFHAAVLAMWKYGLDTIIDHVLQEDNWYKELKELIDHEQTVFVGIFCNLKELKRREKSRKDREIGLARYQFDRVHKNKKYTIKVDTSEHNIQECSDKIISTIKRIHDF